MDTTIITSFRDELEKIGAELTTSARADLPKSDFAVKAKKSNTGKPAYPIPDRQHASSALGFAKMHGDAADLASVRSRIAKKFPDMVKKAMSERMVNALQALRGEAGPALGATLGAGAAGYLGQNPLSGAALGYGVGSVPEILHNLRGGGKKLPVHNPATAGALTGAAT